jgi:hypothetical protein
MDGGFLLAKIPLYKAFYLLHTKYTRGDKTLVWQQKYFIMVFIMAQHIMAQLGIQPGSARS